MYNNYYKQYILLYNTTINNKKILMQILQY